ncbi:DUF6232 family protein [Paraburkholderia dinghuensis]|uniref:QacE n=1 Tax=Paraburkholderia dinghuensis TaxID=2305225 RepID=A0A3N6PZG6_9BURK|nr:DUF6232 family protein [Paraburkholderia dinghuensis]RQH05366.1 hypothetical protein D1Y85_14985 [Paraburkholderia dinghuensis]
MELPFNEAGVSVTRTALSVAGQVFPLRDIDDVQIVTVRRNHVVPICLSTSGAILAAGGYFLDSPTAFVCGLMLFVIGMLTWYSQDITHQLIVVKGSERREALSSLDPTFVERVEQAVRFAMAGRGDGAVVR